MSNKTSTGDVLLIGGAIIGGAYLIGKLGKKNEVIVQGSENWEGVNKIVDQLGQQNSAFLDSITQILGQQTTSPLPSGGSSSGGSSADPDKTIEDTKQVLQLTNTALDKLGYSGLYKQSQTLMKEQEDKDAVTIASNPILNTADRVLNTGSQKLGGVSVNLNPISALSPSSLAKTWSGIHGFGEWAYNKVTGKKNVDDPLSVL